LTGIIAGRRSVRAGCIAGLLAFLACAAAPRGAAADFDFHPPAVPDDPAAAAIMRDLAQRILPVYQEPDPDLYLDNLSALQIVAGDFAAAYGTRQSLRNRRSGADDAGPVGREVTYDVYAYAKAKQAAYRLAFADAFAAAFNELVPRRRGCLLGRHLDAQVSAGLAKRLAAGARSGSGRRSNRSAGGGGSHLEIPVIRGLSRLRQSGRSARCRG
jgi:hypothetical protein